jgi:hypothetical protein
MEDWKIKTLFVFILTEVVDYGRLEDKGCSIVDSL